MKQCRKWTVLALCAALYAGAASAGEVGTMAKADALRAEPFSDAKTLKAFAAGEKLDILLKQGGWYKVKSGKLSGWVRMLSVSKGDAKKGTSTASGLLALSSGRAGTGKVVATTGVRGLNDEELKAAKFDEAELKRAEANASSKADAAKFAKQGKLVARPFDYLPEVK
ncbi:MAG: SH3 domain-containing protein [Sideroxydans sp.]|nr:SH3 domain-containing protein [Sideroxydans sp.]